MALTPYPKLKAALFPSCTAHGILPPDISLYHLLQVHKVLLAQGKKGLFAAGGQGLFLWDPWCGAEVHSFILSCFFRWSLDPVGLQCWSVRKGYSCSVQGTRCLILQKLQYLNLKMFVAVRELEIELWDNDVEFLCCHNVFFF